MAPIKSLSYPANYGLSYLIELQGLQLDTTSPSGANVLAVDSPAPWPDSRPAQMKGPSSPMVISDYFVNWFRADTLVN